MGNHDEVSTELMRQRLDYGARIEALEASVKALYEAGEIWKSKALEYEAILVDLWPLIPPQAPSPEFTARMDALVSSLAKANVQHISEPK